MEFQKILSHSTKKPQSILKIIISISAALLVMWLFLVFRMDMDNAATAQASEPEVIERTQGLKNSLLINNEAKTQKVQEAEESPAMFQKAFLTFMVMISVLGGVWLWSKKKGDNPARKESSRELGGHVLGQGVQLKFVEVNREVWVLGVSSGSVNLMHRIPKSEWKEGEEEIKSQELGVQSIKETGKSDFKSLYKFFTN